MKKSVLVTGATGGTGLAIAQRFAKEGYAVFITSRDGERAKQAADGVAAEFGVFAKGYALDTQGEQGVIAVFEDIEQCGYLISTVVCNAANLGIGMDSLTVPLEQFMEVFNTNIGWNFLIARAGALQMKRNGGGAIVFITSNTAYRAIPGRVAYGASKSGILGMSRALAVDWGCYNIRCNCVLPGMIKTDRWLNNPELRRVPSNYTPIGDIAEFEDIANAAYFLGSEQSRNVTGAEITVDGGNMIQLYPQIPEA